MFLGREKELKELKDQLSSDGKTAVLIYGKRRIGKSTLIAQASRSFNGIVINHLCVQSTFAGNIEMLSRSVCMALNLPQLHFSTLMDLFDSLKAQKSRMLVILDEYQYLKNSGKRNEVDSYMQDVIDHLNASVKLILCGSYITIMRELLEEENPLFGRFTSVIHLEEFNYLESAGFYPKASVRRKIENYAVFGGSPYVLSTLNQSLSLEENIKKLLLPATGLLRIHIENVMLKEIQKAYDTRIFAVIGNGKKRYSEINDLLGTDNNGLLGKQLTNLMDMDAVKQTFPINRPNDKKKCFYVIDDNLMRFYFTFIFGYEGIMARLGADAFFDLYIKDKLLEFISWRFEDIALQYFEIRIRRGLEKNILDLGSFWYDDPATKTNGEFDCVLKTLEGYEFYECKFYKNPMKLAECKKEADQVRKIRNLNCSRIGFICLSGFDFSSDEYRLISGDDLFSMDA
ncbi:MAG: ATP-binding protein [Lactimicrobium sp.]|uniref:AAA family ATPase n=2 Tax=Lactimicrobium sp. TaxID=2563780 RepID=UPI002F356893